MPLFRLGAGQEAILGAMVKDAAQRLSSQMGAKLLGGASVGSWKDGAGIISGLLQESNPSLAIAPALGGGGQNLEEIEEGSGAYALTVASSLVDAREGRGPFRRRLERLRAVMHLSELHFLIVVRADLKVQEFGELTRLRVSRANRVSPAPRPSRTPCCRRPWRPASDASRRTPCSISIIPKANGNSMRTVSMRWRG